MFSSEGCESQRYLAFAISPEIADICSSSERSIHCAGSDRQVRAAVGMQELTIDPAAAFREQEGHQVRGVPLCAKPTKRGLASKIEELVFYVKKGIQLSRERGRYDVVVFY